MQKKLIQKWLVCDWHAAHHIGEGQLPELKGGNDGEHHQVIQRVK